METRAAPRGYRERIYRSYVSAGASSELSYDEREYRAQGAAIHARVRRWLPADRAAPVLDIGCGPGFFLCLLERLGYTDVTGVDLSPEQVALARRNCGRATVVLGDALEVLAANPGRFALVTGFDFVEHFSKDELFPLLEAVAAALRPGGRVILQTPNAASPFGSMLRYGDLTHEIAFHPHSLGHALRMAGLGDIEFAECGPRVHGVRSLLRAVVWKGIRAGLVLWNLAETGNTGGGVYTRVFTATGRKP
jgi:SAM-dependent methyltransferase